MSKQEQVYWERYMEMIEREDYIQRRMNHPWLDWRPYPEEKPNPNDNHRKRYLVRLREGQEDISEWSVKYRWVGHIDRLVIYWAEIPDPEGEADDLTMRRAIFVYEGARLATRASDAPFINAPWDDMDSEFKAQFIEMIKRQCGDQRSTSPEELHGSWMQAHYGRGWVYGESGDSEKTHLDAGFVALCEIARLWIRE